MNNRNDSISNNPIDIPSFMNNRDIRGQKSTNIHFSYEEDYDSDAFIKEVNSSLAKQVRTDSQEPKKSSGSGSNNKKRPRKKKGGFAKFLKVTASILLLFIAVASLLLFTDSGRKLLINTVGNYIYGNLSYASSDDADSDEAITDLTLDKSVVNILLIGEEQIGGAKNTDSMMIATLNKDDHSLKLTSIMRDLYVDIPGHDKSKLNSAFGKGGIDLLYETIENNFEVDLDGYCMVDFEAFETIVDMVGGVDITLTEEEAEYLRTTNYISKKSNRTVVAGVNHMNGNQALGYCRVRKVSTGTENNDFGRTQRQRVVLDAIFDEVKSKNVLQLAMLMNNILKDVEIQTDITQKEFNLYLNEASKLKVQALKTFRIPTDGSYDNERVPMGKYNVEVLVPKDWSVTRQELHDFIYGSTAEASTTEGSTATE
ncbi:MAG: cell envelope-related transcriptional attenuator [Herbinix sp.]|jgi:LCP family protein required for cell wall assembly|nr:cell envelope-related transcriptional attenuator [Herbinix sp.]